MADPDAGLTPAPAVDESYGPPPVAANTTPGRAIAALVCGILSLVGGLIIPFVGLILGAVAVVLGVMVRKEIAANAGLGGSGMALAGIVTGAIGIALTILLIALVVALD